MSNKKLSKHRLGNSYLFGIMYFCLMMTGVMFVLVYFEDLIKSMGLLWQTFSTLLFGIAGIGLGGILCEMLGKLEDRIDKIKRDEDVK